MAISEARFSPKTDNNPQAFAAKVKIRRAVLEAVGDKARVFDAFAGAGEMFAAVWKDAASYTGCDLKWSRDGRLMFAADNRRVLRAIDLKQFNIFDLDAYGLPWEQAFIIAERRPINAGEIVGLVVTEGAGVGYQLGNVSHAVSKLAGLRAGTGIAPGMGWQREHMFDKVIFGLAKKTRCEIVSQWRGIGKTGQRVIYCGLVLRGRSAEAA